MGGDCTPCSAALIVRRACSVKGPIRDPRSAWASSISVSAVPDSSSGITTSLRHQAVSVSAMRRRLSP